MPTTPEHTVRLAFTVRFDEGGKKWIARAIADPSITGTDRMATLALTAAFREAEKRYGASPYADPETADKQHISRINTKVARGRNVPTVGWQARIDTYYKGKRVLIASRFFGDHAWGGEGYALAQAIEFRDKFAFLRDMPLAKAQAKARVLGLVGRLRLTA